MKFGLIPVNIGVTAPEQLFAIALTAEDADYENVWTFEHVIVPLDYQSKFPYAASGEVVEHDSDFLDWHGFKSHPLPVQRPGVPIHMGRRASKIYQLIARHGDGWFIPGAGPDELSAMLGYLRAACAAEGRDMEEIKLTAMWSPKGGEDSLKVLADLGIVRVAPIASNHQKTIKSIAEA